MAARTPARDGRSTDTRERILQVAEHLYADGGYERINLHVIADQIGVSKTALFHHFKNKQELFYATLLHILARYRELFADALAGEGQSVRERLRHIMVGLTQQGPFDMMRFAREEFILLSPEQQTEVERAWRASLFDAVRRLLEDGVRRGELRGIDLSLSTYVFMHLCMLLPSVDGVRHSTLATPRDEVSVGRAIDALLDLYLSGVGRRPVKSAGAPDAS